MFSSSCNLPSSTSAGGRLPLFGRFTGVGSEVAHRVAPMLSIYQINSFSGAMKKCTMETKASPCIVAAERMGAGIFIEFDDGKSALYTRRYLRPLESTSQTTSKTWVRTLSPSNALLDLKRKGLPFPGRPSTLQPRLGLSALARPPSFRDLGIHSNPSFWIERVGYSPWH